MDHKTREVRLGRQYRFSAAHFLHSPYLSEEENRKVFGKCGRKAGHGHNYILRVVVSGKVDEMTGMVIDLSRLDDIVNRKIIIPFDHKNLNEELSPMQVLTSEVLIAEIWKRLKPHFNSPRLYKIEIDETPKNSFEYYG